MLADDDLIDRIGQRLLAVPEVLADGAQAISELRTAMAFDLPPVPAAVLIALVQRPGGHTILYTERSPSLRSHSGQVAFPGGKIDPTDSGPGAAAVREAWEEVGLEPEDVRILGYMPQYYTGTNYLITPVVAEVAPRGAFVPNPDEVDAVFEVPLTLVAAEASFGTFQVMHRGIEHTTWRIDHEGHRIWGITADLTRRFRDLALAGETSW